MLKGFGIHIVMHLELGSSSSLVWYHSQGAHSLINLSTNQNVSLTPNWSRHSERITRPFQDTFGKVNAHTPVVGRVYLTFRPQDLQWWRLLSAPHSPAMFSNVSLVIVREEVGLKFVVVQVTVEVDQGVAFFNVHGLMRQEILVIYNYRSIVHLIEAKATEELCDGSTRE